ncbi:probable E3 ubiquitin-protein ligase bre1 [Monomorium pharaonis]|uniref:probable E3 ubiquitin-protein ligase bre1 n=1 Tax=Monomorium pharaonis TaxID=307658 RepID=UPI00174696B3|nr:probable E3 ubiquitin-protein ligase bre1 [Monomorium pharaonis]
MSMLAERRRKQKWSLNPRGKWWTEDSNKFGQRMLEKMGWTKGKGLGANEQGITEFSATSYKNDTTGVGFDKNVEAWTEQMDKFSEFLQQLNETQDQVDIEDSNLNGQSIELKSKENYVHYKKFTHGKGTNKHISKDLACTSDQKESVNKTDNTQINIEKNSNERKVSECRDDWYGVVTINGGNMTDYFKHKANYKMSKYLKCNQLGNDMNLSNSRIDNRMTDSENEDDQHVGFGFTSKIENISASNYGALKNSDDKSNFAFDNPCLGLNSPIKTVETSTNDSSAMSRKKRKKKFENNDSYITETDKHHARKKLRSIDGDCKSGFVNPALNLETKPEEDCNGKEFEVFRTQFGLENCGLDLLDEIDDKKRVTFNDHVMLYEYNMNSTKKKKGEVTLDKFEVENKKKNKKRKCESATTPATNGFINEALDEQILYEEINDNELNEHRNKKVKKRKISKISHLETIQESPEKEIEEINLESEDTLDISIVENGETDIVEQKSKKKKKNKEKKKRTKVEDITVLQVSNEEPDIVIEKIISKSKKVKKAKQSKEEEETTISKKHKKKKKDKENCKSEKQTIQIEINNDQDIGILDKSNIEIESFSLTKDEEEEKELKRTKQKKKKRKSITKEDCLNEINVYNMIEDTLPVSSFKEKKEEKELEKTKQEKKNSINKDCSNEITVYNITETLLVSSIKETEEKELQKVKQKKNRKSTNKEDCPNEINTEKEISDKENTDKEKDTNTKILTKKDKKSKKSKDKNVFDIEDSSNPNTEVVDANVIKQDKIENTECTDTPSKKGKVSEVIDNIISSPWSVKARMSKKMLITFFHNNAILEFPGSNSHKIKGYGTDIDCEL